MSQSEQGLYQALEKELRESTDPLDCASLFDKAAVRQHAATVNCVSDYLGNMWRKGLVVRLPAPKADTTRARWMYAWKGRKKTELPTMDQAIDYLDKQMILQRPSIEISEAGGSIRIELPHLVISIQIR